MGAITLETTRSGRTRSAGLRTLAYTFGPHLSLIAAWEGARIALGASPATMPSLLDVALAIGGVVRNGILPDYIFRSLVRIGVAGAISILGGVTLGVAIGLNAVVSNFVTPVLRYFNSLSGIVWLPLFIIWFGFNDRTIVATICYAFLFPVVFNTVVGVRMVPKVFRHAVLTLGGSWFDVVFGVVLPGALPSIMAGIRLGFGYGWRAVIAGEMALGAGGLGYMIFKAQSVNLTDRILAGMLIIGGLWSLMDHFILQPLEEATIRRWGLAQR